MLVMKVRAPPSSRQLMSRVHLTVHGDGNCFVLQLELLSREPTSQVRLCWPSHHFHNPGSAPFGNRVTWAHEASGPLVWGCYQSPPTSRTLKWVWKTLEGGRKEGRAPPHLSSRGSSIMSLRPLTGPPSALSSARVKVGGSLICGHTTQGQPPCDVSLSGMCWFLKMKPRLSLCWQLRVPSSSWCIFLSVNRFFDAIIIILLFVIKLFGPIKDGILRLTK